MKNSIITHSYTCEYSIHSIQVYIFSVQSTYSPLHMNVRPPTACSSYANG
jgi:hypothetical protein